MIMKTLDSSVNTGTGSADWPRPVRRFLTILGRRLTLTMSLCAVAALPGTSALANPTGSSVVSGNVVFEVPNSGTLNVYNSPGAIINWNDFSIGVDELTRFIQESANSAVLNRVTGNNISEIMGQLVSNGQVFLVNPNGTLIGPDAVIDTSSFVVSSLDLKDHDFLGNHLQFTGDGDSGDIINSGVIRSGNILLIAPKIENRGSLISENGQITLAAGESLLVTSLDQPEIQFAVQSGGNSVLNVGDISNAGGAIDVFANTIHNQGVVGADSVSIDASGSVRLIANEEILLDSGSRISASGIEGGAIVVDSGAGTARVAGEIESIGLAGNGGSVTLLGTRIAVDSGSSINASGTTGGGEISIGGNREGQGPLPNSKAIAILPDAMIRANALEQGDGGTIIAFAEDTANIFGSLQALGGSLGGNGGFIETSGLASLTIATTPDAGASSGEAGTWLIDPYNISIEDVLTSQSILDLPGAGFLGEDIFEPLGDSAVLAVSSIIDSLSASTSVIVRTWNAAGTQDGNITLATPLNIPASAAGTSLTLDADGAIYLNEPITNLAAGFTLSLLANEEGNNVFLNADINAGPGIFDADPQGGDNNNSLLFSGSDLLTISSSDPDGGFKANQLSIDGSGTIRIDTNAFFQSLSLEQGSLDLGGTASVSGAFNWTGGAIRSHNQLGALSLGAFDVDYAGSGSIFGGSVTVSDNFTMLGGSTLDILGGSLTVEDNFSVTADATLNLSAGGVVAERNLSLTDVATLNLSGGTFDVGGGLEPPTSGGSGSLPSGPSAKSGGAGTTLAETATINISGGVLNQGTSAGLRGTNSEINGILNLTGGVLAGRGGSDDLTIGATGVLNITGGSLDLDGYLLNYGTINFAGPGTAHRLDLGLYNSSEGSDFGQIAFNQTGTTSLSAVYVGNSGLVEFNSGIVEMVAEAYCEICSALLGGGYGQYIESTEIQPVTRFNGGLLRTVDGVLDNGSALAPLAANFTLFEGSLEGDLVQLDIGSTNTLTESTVDIASDVDLSSVGTLAVTGDTIDLTDTDLGGVESMQFSANRILFDVLTIAPGSTFDLSNSGAVSGNTITNTGGVLLVSSPLTLNFFAQTAGTTDLSGGSLTSPNPINIAGGTLKGNNATVFGDLVMGGTLAPGASPGTLVIDGNLFLQGSSLTQFELGGYGQGVTYDLINVLGNLTVDPNANAQVLLFGGFSPYVGIPFSLINYVNAFGPGGAPNPQFGLIDAPFAFISAVEANQFVFTPGGTLNTATTNPFTGNDLLVLTDNDGAFDSELSGNGAQEIPGGENESARAVMTSSLGDRFIWCE